MEKNLSELYREWRLASEEMLEDGYTGSLDCGEQKVREDFSNFAELEEEITFEQMFELEKEYENFGSVNQFKQLKKWLEKTYGEGSETTITYEGKTYTGCMYGNDECYDCDRFYQYFLTNNTLYRAFYEIPDGETDLGNLDYEKPTDMEEQDIEYFVDYVI